MIPFVPRLRAIDPAQRADRGPVVALGVGLACLIGAAAALAPFPAARAAAPTNTGGVLVLHVENAVTYDYGTFGHCDDLGLTEPADAVTRIPGDGLPHLVGLYAVFPPDSVGSVRGFSFGIRYTEGVRIIGEAACNAGGMFIGMNGWPSSNGGMSVHIAVEGAKRSRVIPLYWFAIAGKAQGSFEIIPHPVPKLAGRLVNAETPYVQEPILGYGRIGIDQDGFAPTPGGRAVLAPCCVLGDCWYLTRSECEIYRGDFLGVGMSCQNAPCGERAWLGGCCLPGGCEALTLLDCARRGGTPLGEGVRCGDAPCPPAPGPDSTGVAADSSASGTPPR